MDHVLLPIADTWANDNTLVTEQIIAGGSSGTIVLLPRPLTCGGTFLRHINDEGYSCAPDNAAATGHITCSIFLQTDIIHLKRSACCNTDTHMLHRVPQLTLCS